MLPDTPPPRSGPLVAACCSLTFWLCLFTAAALYAAAALSPKLYVHGALQAEYQSNQWQLVSLERQVAQLRRVTEAQRNDPAFVRAQAQSDFEVPAPGEERIPVDSHLTLQIGPGRAEATARRTALPAYMPLVGRIAASRTWSDALLATAAALVIGAFALLPVRRS